MIGSYVYQFNLYIKIDISIFIFLQIGVNWIIEFILLGIAIYIVACIVLAIVMSLVICCLLGVGIVVATSQNESPKLHLLLPLQL